MTVAAPAAVAGADYHLTDPRFRAIDVVHHTVQVHSDDRIKRLWVHEVVHIHYGKR